LAATDTEESFGDDGPVSGVHGDKFMATARASQWGMRMKDNGE
jgi:hypothetical protein